MRTSWRSVACAGIVCLSLNSGISQAAIQGTFRIKLTKPVDKELQDRARGVATRNMTGALVDWINDHSEALWDTSNSIYRYHLERLLESCAQNSQVASEFNGRIWAFTLTLSDSSRHAVIVRHNATTDSLALLYWARAVQAFGQGRNAIGFKAGVGVIFHAMGHIGDPLKAPDDRSGRYLRDIARDSVQSFLRGVRVQTNAYILEGIPGMPAVKPPIVRAFIDSMPLPRLPINAFLPLGRKVFAAETDVNGELSLAAMKLPYAANGTFLYVKPSFDGILDVPVPFQAKDLGLSVASSQEQALMLKLTPATYTLSYKVHAVSQTDSIPADFAESRFFEKFLRDSCFLHRASSAQAASIGLDVLCQISDYVNDIKKTRDIKVEGRIVVSPLKRQGQRLERSVVVYEKSYELDQDISFGLFYWEAAAKLKQIVREMLAQY